MKTIFYLKSIFLLIILFSKPLYAQDYYVCNNGMDTNPGTSPNQPWLTFDFALSKFNTLKGGDSILFCRNGTFTSSLQIKLFNKNCSAGQPCTIADYVSPSDPKIQDYDLPLIASMTDKGIFNFQDSGNADHDEGYVIKNLSLKGNGYGYGIFLFNDVDFVTIDGLILDGFNIGVYSAGANALNPEANQFNENIRFINSTITNNVTQGWLGACNNCLISHNQFVNNGFGRNILNHNIYIGGKNNFGITISNNMLYKSAIVNGKCSGVSLVVHGVVSDLTIKDNTIMEDLNAAEQTCWGISVDPGWDTEEFFTNVLIANNNIINVGNVGIGCASCTDLKILDNKILHSQDFGFVGIKVPVKAEDSVKSDQVVIKGNYFDLKDPNKKGKVGVIERVVGDIEIGANKISISN
jgi:hypothetical protein